MTEQPPSGSVTEALQAHVARIIGTAEQAANDLQREVEAGAAQRAAAVRAQAESDAARIHAAAEAAAARIHADAEARAQAYLEEMRRRGEAVANARVDRITELTDTLIAKGEAIQPRLDEAVEMQTQLRALLSALAGAAEAAAAESARPPLRLPRVLEAARPLDASDSGGLVPPDTAAGRPVADVDAGIHVQRIARDLPRSPRSTSPSEDQPA